LKSSKRIRQIPGYRRFESPIFFARQRRREAETRKTVFSEAHFFERRELKELLGRYGNARVVTSTYLYPSAPGVKLGAVFEVLGKIFFRRGGAFLVGRVDKETEEQENEEASL